jgi:pantetheine-phosphate adenylyltransferase
MTTALYIGSFDPFTLGHADIARQALLVFDRLHIGIGDNPKKQPMFSIEERKRMIVRSISQAGLDANRVSVRYYSGSMMQEARDLKVNALVRGLRQISDFGDEFTINGMVARSIPEIPLTYFICRQDFLHVSSSSVKEMFSLGEDIDWMVTPSVKNGLIYQRDR